MEDEAWKVAVLRKLWSGLDTATYLLMSGVKAKGHREVVGMARATAMSIAIVIDPEAPDYDSVKKEAMRRWRVRNEAQG